MTNLKYIEKSMRLRHLAATALSALDQFPGPRPQPIPPQPSLSISSCVCRHFLRLYTAAGTDLNRNTDVLLARGKPAHRPHDNLD